MSGNVYEITLYEQVRFQVVSLKNAIWFEKYKKLLYAGFSRLIAFARYPAVRITINVLVIGFCVFYLISHYNSIAEKLKQVQIHWAWLALSALLTLVTVWTSAIAWWLLLRAFHQPICFSHACQAHLKSSVAKYVPGYAWQFLGKAYLTRQLGVPTKLTSILILWEFVLLIWSGLSIALLIVPRQLLILWKVSTVGNTATMMLGFVLLLSLLAFPFVLNHRITKFLPQYKVKPFLLLLSIFMIISGWLLLGLILSTLSAAFGYPLPGQYVYFVFTFSISLLAGILAIPVPNGLGVREGIMAYLLSFFIPLPIAVVLSAIARLEIVAGDLISVIIIEGMVQNQSKNTLKTNSF